MKDKTRRRLLLAIGAFGAGLAAAFFVIREPMELLTRDALAVARSRWDEAAVTAYDIRYLMNGDEYGVQVRDGVVSEVSVNGVRPVGSDWRNYSVGGLFDMLEMETENVMGPAGPFAGRKNAVVAKVEFDEVLGYPKRYLRSGGGMRPACVEVIEFTPVRADAENIHDVTEDG